jgi:hypothetical protein
MDNLPALPSPALEDEIAALARAYRAANHPVMTGLNALGGGIEAQMARLPAGVRKRMEAGVGRALAMGLGLSGRLPRLGRRPAMAVSAVVGAAGGAAGVFGTLAELPVTVTLILTTIRAEAEAAGFDPGLPGVQEACLQVFAAGSPLTGDDGSNSAFLSARLAVNGAAIEKMIAATAPQLMARLGGKLAAQSVPILGALAGASVNAAYSGYFRDMARIRFALMRLSVRHGGEEVVRAFIEAAGPKRLPRD